MYQVKSYHIPAEQIEKELNDIETNLAQLEKEGVELEKKLRSCEEGTFFWHSSPGTNISHFLPFPCLDVKIELKVEMSETALKIKQPLRRLVLLQKASVWHKL